MLKRGRNGGRRRGTMGTTMGLVGAGTAADPKYAGVGGPVQTGYNPNLPAGADPTNYPMEPAPSRVEALGGATISSAIGGALTALLMFQIAKWMKKDMSKLGDLVTVGTVTTVGIGVISALFFGWRGFSIRVMDPRPPAPLS